MELLIPYLGRETVILNKTDPKKIFVTFLDRKYICFICDNRKYKVHVWIIDMYK